MFRTGLIGFFACLVLVSTVYDAHAQQKRDRGRDKQVTQPPPDQGSPQVTQPPPDQGPTLTETMDWLTKALAEHAGFFPFPSVDKPIRVESPSASGNSCTLSYSASHFECPCRWVPKAEGLQLSRMGLAEIWMMVNFSTDREQHLVWDGKEGKGTYTQDRVAIDLTGIDPVSVQVVQQDNDPKLWTIKFESSSGRTAIEGVQVLNRVTLKQFKDTGTIRELASLGERTEQHGPARKWEFWGFQEREMAKRVEAAFKHAVKLCGGKVSPF